jgi:subtilisin family serine protease
MRHFSFLFTLLLLIGVASTQVAKGQSDIVPGQVIVMLDYQTDINDVLKDVNDRNALADFKVNRVLSKRINTFLLDFDVDHLTSNEAINLIATSENTALVQFNHNNVVLRDTLCPDDTRFDEQWDYYNDGTNGSGGNVDISACDAWSLETGGYTKVGDRIVVAVIDGGYDLNHVDMNFWTNSAEIPNDNQDNDNNGYIDDVNGWDAVANDNDVMFSGQFDDHGTHVAGTMGAIGNNATGVTGVNWDVEVMGVTGSSGNEATVVAAYGYVLEQRAIYNQTNGASGAFVVSTNSSFGVDNADPANYPIWCAFYDTLGTYGILSAGATANNNVNIDVVGDVPTACPGNYMISVTNTNSADVRGSAGYGQTTIDLAAPGTNILSTEPNDDYGNKTGTSMATPHVAGTIGLMWAAACPDMVNDYHANPGALALTMRNYLLNDGTDAVAALATETVTGGRLNLHKAVLATEQYGSCPPLSVREFGDEAIYHLYPNPNNGQFTLTMTLFEKGDYTLNLRNTLGQLVDSRNLIVSQTEHTVQYNVDQLVEKGIYFLQITNNVDQSKLVKLVVQ